ncbi:PbpA [Lederbergia lenta]|uniref:serine-type D-Ala-D-Ala carboxypeptidase n=2 Tax=Lederbergia lenta TaxID=1467 RepID=A0A2X4W047_LEDLE|nr:PbpA [Lederbergia lenta]
MKNKDKKKKSHVPIRMNMLFFIVFLLFAILILRLGVIQIVYGEDAKREIERTDDVTVSTSTPRGLIYDKNLKLLVDNKPRKAITYTPAKTPNQKETLETAEALAKIIKQDTDKITERDKIDFWILKNPKEAEAKITKEEKEKYEGKENESEMYKLQRERVTEEELASLSQEDLEVLAIYREFTSGYALVPQIVKNDNVTKEELAFVSEHLSLLPGVDTTTDWERQYVFKDTLRSILGGITSGLPAENIDYYLSRGYSRNDRVGKSYLELQYEDVLRGQKEKVKNVTRSGNVLETVLLQEGMRGKDLVLTIDIELQQAVDKIIEEALINTKRKGGTGLLDRAFVVLMDPNTGEILSLSGKQYLYNEEKGKYEFTDFAAGNFTTSYVVGSSVKGATVLTGYMTGAINPNNTSILDEPLHILKTPVKSSWFNRGGNNVYLTDRQALARSSNVYMFKTAIAIGGGQYRRNQPLGIDKELAFSEMRNHFGQLGLGVRTGIDLPGEQIGYQGNVETAEPGKVLDFSIGQFDTFTPLQLAQYVSTIANGGYRMQPQIVKEIREPGDKDGGIGPLAQAMEPKVLNKVETSKEIVERVQQGFWEVFHSPRGTGKFFKDKPYRAAGKTGTAETREQGTDVWNLTLVAYAPYENPEVAMSVVVPSAYLNVRGGAENQINSEIGDKVLQAYFDLKANRGKEDKNEDNVED